MGQALTARLVEVGFEVYGYDLEPNQVERAQAHGVIPVGSIAQLSAHADIVQICVTSTDAVTAIALAADGLINSPGQAQVIIDHSTSTVAETRRIAARFAAQTSVQWLDAPVSGGPPAARNGTLAVMTGGSEAGLQYAQPVLSAIAATSTHMGSSGAGQVTKMVNQILVLNNYCLLAEALAMAEAGGVDAEQIPAALASGHAGSNLLASMFPRFIARDYAPAGYARQVLKDLDMVQDLARTLNVPTPMSAQANAMFRTLVSKGGGELDGLSIMKLYDPKEKLGVD
jgi:3-hydroxyisobutyrate dehydrogenase